VAEHGRRVRVLLRSMVEDISFDGLPPNWSSFDLKKFSREKVVWNFQQGALENAVKVLWKYYEDFADYRPDEDPETNLARKKKLFQWYRDNGLTEDLDIAPGNAKGEILRLLEDYYTVEAGRISYEQLINRMCFWMATGAGKSVVLIKLIQVLWLLVRRGEIPPNDILVLTCRDDLLNQFKGFVQEFNSASSDFKIRLRELKEYPDAKRETPLLYREREITVFYYRSDNLSDEQKEKIIDFRGYDNGGRWYVLLDEAHKGDREESKRQHIYSILSRNGFLFNFSATFADKRDYITTVFNFNLSEFTKEGYGKHILILKQELRSFKGEEDYSGAEKQKAVLKSLILLAYARKFSEEIARISPGVKLYHRPLLLVLAHTVETGSADLKLFFRELVRIGRGRVADAVWKRAKNELWKELKERPSFMFEEEDRAEINHRAFQDLSKEDLLRWVYNSTGWGEIEVLVRPSNRKELAFKLKTSDRPFALVKIGDISGWLKDELAGYEINERFEDESYFETLNRDDSEINILMGSRGFYVGWDSNRPNVINFINIGTGIDAKKFILQSVGRGVRIQPLENKRKRLLHLLNAGEVDKGLFDMIKDLASPLETLFIFGTNRKALYEVIKYLDQERGERGHRLSLFVSEEAKEHKLLIPTYAPAPRPPAEQRPPVRFEVTREELGLLKRYIGFIRDDRVLLALYDAEPEKIGILKKSLEDPDSYYRPSERSFKNVDLLVRQILRCFDVIPEELKELKELGDEIRHFKNIQVVLKDISDLQKKIDAVRQYRDLITAKKAKLGEKLKGGDITLEEYTDEIMKIAETVRGEEMIEREGVRLRIKHVAHHYYVPLILSDDEKAHFIKHIIKTPSEVRFINELEKYLGGTNKFKEFDWWMFSKLDESLDDVYIPYYDPRANAIHRFKPDFIFWLQKGDNYFIVFIDPKSRVYTDYQHKVQGYRELFEEGGDTKIIPYQGLNVGVFAFLYTENRDGVAEEYRKYWFDSIDEVLGHLLELPKQEK